VPGEIVRLMSALPPKADIAERGWHVRFVPKADSCAAAKPALFDHLVYRVGPWTGSSPGLSAFRMQSSRQQPFNSATEQFDELANYFLGEKRARRKATSWPAACSGLER
jgi:hypothetical protein